MFINLSEVFSSEGSKETVEAPVELQSFQSRLGDFPIVEKPPVVFAFTNDGVNKAKVEGGVRLVLKAGCDRCLAEVPVVLDLKFDRVVTSPEGSTEEEADDIPDFMEGYQLNTETFVYDEILVNWPTKILCKEDCKGVCPVCGQNRNLRECGCDTFVPDPRMAVIKDIFNANKEV